MVLTICRLPCGIDLRSGTASDNPIRHGIQRLNFPASPRYA